MAVSDFLKIIVSSHKGAIVPAPFKGRVKITVRSGHVCQRINAAPEQASFPLGEKWLQHIDIMRKLVGVPDLGFSAMAHCAARYGASSVNK
jgi:hypothetical protein